MDRKERATKTMKVSDTKNAFSSVVDEVYRNDTRVIIERSGIPVAAIISATDLDRLVRYEQRRAKRFKAIDELREAFKNVPVEEIEREADRAVAEIRGKIAAAV